MKESKESTNSSSLFEFISTTILEVWLYITVGLIALVAFFGKRLIKRWDTVVDPHLTASEVKRLLNESDKANQKKHEETFHAVELLSTRMDKLYELLVHRSVPQSSLIDSKNNRYNDKH